MRNAKQIIAVFMLVWVGFMMSRPVIASQSSTENPTSIFDIIRQEMNKNTEPNKPVQTTRTIQPDKSTEPVEPVEIAKPIEPDKTKQVETQTAERILHFPKDRPIGQLAIGEEKTTGELPFGYPKEEIEWENYGLAQGDVKIPIGKVVKLVLSSWTWQNPANLSVLKQLKPNDIYSLDINGGSSSDNIKPTDNCMPYVAYLTGLNTLDIMETDITAKGLEYLKKLNSLERLSPPRNLDDSGITAIGNCKSLKTLYLVFNNIVTDKGLAQLAKLKSLEHLGLESTNMTDEGLKKLSALSSLIHLTLVGNFTNEAILYLKDVKSLKSLHIEINSFDDRGMKYVSELEQLENFNAHRMSGITDSGIAYLKNMPNLKKLDFYAANITDNSMQVLGKIHTLEHLLFPDATDEGMKYVTDLQNLKYLYVGIYSDSPLTDESLRYISQLKNLEQLDICGTGISDEGMKHIAKLTKLKQLSFGVSDVLTNKGLDELANLNSLTKLNLGEYTKVSISDLKSLNRLKNLKRLDLGGLYQDNSSAMDISGLTELEHLDIALHRTVKDGTRVYDAFREQDWPCLANLKKLKDLRLVGSGITDNALKYLSELKNLEMIDILTMGEMRLTDESIKSLTGMKKLYLLTIRDGHFTDKALEYLSKIPSLRQIMLTSDFAFSNKAITNLQTKNPNIEHLLLIP